MARNRRWRMSKPDWLRTFDECLTEPDESHLVRATVAFDFRPAAGGLAVAADLTARIRAAREHPQFMRLLAARPPASPSRLASAASSRPTATAVSTSSTGRSSRWSTSSATTRWRRG